MILFGLTSAVLAELVAGTVQPIAAANSSIVYYLFATAPTPPMPLYFLAGAGVASVVIGLCLKFTDWFIKTGILKVMAPAGRQTLTLYVAHILIGMGTLEGMGMLADQTLASALVAALLFCSAAAIYAVIWARYFKRGPLEALMRWVAG